MKTLTDKEFSEIMAGVGMAVSLLREVIAQRDQMVDENRELHRLLHEERLLKQAFSEMLFASLKGGGYG